MINEYLDKTGLQIYHNKVKQELTGVKSQLAQNAQEVVKSTQQRFVKLTEYQALDYRNLTPENLYTMFEIEPYLSHPRFTRKIIGLDSSGQYNIRSYTYAPPSYDRTIFLVGGLHGGEVFGSWFIIELFKTLLSDTVLPHLRDIKNNVRIIAIPVANPWGMYQSSKTRYNSNGVDLNRNFDWNWSNQADDVPFGYRYKGTAPFSEKESQYIRNILLENRNDLTAFIDVHAQSYSTSNGWHYLVYPDDTTTKELQTMLNFLNEDGTKTVVNQVGYNDASSNNYASKVIGLPSMCLEGVSGAFGQIGGSWDNANNLSYYYNSLIVASMYAKIKNAFSVKNYRNTYWDGAITLTNNTQTTINDTVFTFTPPTDGFLQVNGYIVAKKTIAADIFGARPELEQPGSITLVAGTGASSIQNAYTDGLSPIIPIQITIPVVAGKAVNFKVSAINEGTGVCHIKRFNLNLVYLGSKNLNIFAPNAMQGYTFV